VTASALARSLGLDDDALAPVLAALAAQGVALQGSFTPARR
jgi:hypothetical protein